MIQFHAQVFVMGWEKTTICLKKKDFNFLICLENLEVDFLDEQIIIWFVVSNIFYFHPTWGNDPIWLIFFKWVETTNQSLTHTHTFDVLFFSRFTLFTMEFESPIWKKTCLDLFFQVTRRHTDWRCCYQIFPQKRNVNNMYKISDWKLHIWM